MGVAQKPNKHLRTKSNKKTGTAGSRAKRRSRLQHGKGKDSLRSKLSGKGKRRR